MANYFNIILDTTGVPNPTLSIEGGASFATAQLVTLTIGTTESPTTGFQMKIWGNVDTANDANIQATEGASVWITYNTSKQIKLASGDGNKTVYLKLRDDVYNESSQVSDAIILDTTLPTITITGADVTRISKIAGKNVCSFSFSADSAFNEYKVKVVAASGNANDTGTQIGTTNGSTNTSGSAGNYPATTPINVTINGSDIELANTGDGIKIIKVFVKDTSGLWSV